MQAAVSEIRGKITGENSLTTEAGSAPPNWFMTGDLPRLLNSLTTTLMRLSGHTFTEFHQYVQQDRNDYRTAMGIVYSTSVLVVILLCVLVWWVYRAIFYPIRHVHKCVAKLAAGQFESRSRLNTGDEMQELGEAFNDMADKLQTMYRNLNTQVEERSRQLIRSERLASVGFLAAGVAHEINNPLASIAFCAEALQARVSGFLPKENSEADVVKNYLSMIEEEAFRCKAITEKLLDFSRAGVPERIETDLVVLTRDVLEMVKHLGRAREKKLIFEPNETVFCQANPQELKQVLLNLVINALESVDDHGTVEVVVRNQVNDVEIVVRDNGVGMTEEVLENLFEPFFTRSRTGKGTGLGLSISHLIVSQHGGKLEATSEGPNRGSAFTVRLPIRPHLRVAA
jgi:signal transduction histidine kinase